MIDLTSFPNVLTQQYFGNSLMQYLIFFVFIGVSIIIGRIVYYIAQGIIRKLTKKTKTLFDDVVIDIMEEPLVFLIIVFGFYFGYQNLTLTPEMSGVFLNITKMLSTISFAWFIVKFVDKMIEMYLVPVTEKTDSDLDDMLVPVIRKVIKVTLISMAIIMILSNFGYDVTSVIAGLGIGGLAFAFAAKDLLSNIFGGIIIITDKPFKMKQWVDIGGHKGSVVEIGLRSTKLKTGNGEYITVPNKYIAEKGVINYKKYQERLVTMTLGISYATSNSKMEKAKKEIVKIITKHPLVNPDTVGVFFVNFGASTLDLEIRYKLKTNDAGKVREAKDVINTQIKAYAEKEKIDIPYPTTTVLLPK